MNNPPERIYLQWDPEAVEVTWCEDRINDSDIEYARTPNSSWKGIEALLTHELAQVIEERDALKATLEKKMKWLAELEAWAAATNPWSGDSEDG